MHINAYNYIASWYLFLKDFWILCLKNSFQNGILAHCLFKIVQFSYIIDFVNNNMMDILKNFLLIIRM